MLSNTSLYSIPGYRGTGPVEPAMVAEYLKSIPNNRRTEDPTDVRHQDILLPTPFDFLIQTLIDDIINNAQETFGCKVTHEEVWCIRHGKYQQTYPHRHELSNIDWAVVYWAQTPKPCAPLEYYPLGMTGPHMYYFPKAGEYLIFPGSLLHGVRENAADDERISMSFNIRAHAYAH